MSQMSQDDRRGWFVSGPTGRQKYRPGVLLGPSLKHLAAVGTSRPQPLQPYHYTQARPSLESTSYPLALPFRVPETSEGQATDRFGSGPQAGGSGLGAPTQQKEGAAYFSKSPAILRPWAHLSRLGWVPTPHAFTDTRTAPCLHWSCYGAQKALVGLLPEIEKK